LYTLPVTYIHTHIYIYVCGVLDTTESVNKNDYNIIAL